MRQSFIIESFDNEEDFRKTLEILDTVVIQNRDEGDIIYEYGNGELESMVRGRLVFNSVIGKYEPRFWYNINLFNKLKWKIENGRSENDGLDTLPERRRTAKLLSDGKK